KRCWTPVIPRCCVAVARVLDARRFFGRRAQRRRRERAQPPGPRGARGGAVHQRGLAGGRGGPCGGRGVGGPRPQARQLAVGAHHRPVRGAGRGLLRDGPGIDHDEEAMRLIGFMGALVLIGAVGWWATETLAARTGVVASVLASAVVLVGKSI